MFTLSQQFDILVITSLSYEGTNIQFFKKLIFIWFIIVSCIIFFYATVLYIVIVLHFIKT